MLFCTEQEPQLCFPTAPSTHVSHPYLERYFCLWSDDGQTQFWVQCVMGHTLFVRSALSHRCKNPLTNIADRRTHSRIVDTDHRVFSLSARFVTIVRKRRAASISHALMNSSNVMMDVPLEGDSLCRCLTQNELPAIGIHNLSDAAANLIGDHVDLDVYGFGCLPHDLGIPRCQDPACPNCEEEDERRWCHRQWCWIDPNDCALAHNWAQSVVGTPRFYSYATCRSIDAFNNVPRLSSVSGRTYKVGFNHNTGGWVGAFSEKQRNFEGPLEIWSGPVLNFVQQAAAIGNFSIELTPPPDFLLNRSLEFFGGSRFSYCVFATSLGFLDFCIAQYTITEARGATADWLVLGNQPMRIVVPVEGKSTAASLGKAIELTFRPFERTAWLFIVFFAIPFLGALMVLHEYGAPESSFPVHNHVVSRAELLADEDEEDVEAIKRRIPIYQHAVRSVYYSFLSVFRGIYETRVITAGARLHLLGISFFIMTTIAVYTANLTAILTQEALVSPIRSLNDIVDQDLRICSIRTGFLTIQALHGRIGKFVKDPIELGGDGKPGFNCADCNVAQRVFDYLDPVKADTDERYCHVAITQEQDLVVLHAKGQHCNKTAVGLPVANAQTGIPVYSGISKELLSFFYSLMDKGVYERARKESKPDSQCPLANINNELSGMSIVKLMGVWVVSFSFALVGLAMTLSARLVLQAFKEDKTMVLSAYDQHGTRINRLLADNARTIEEHAELTLRDGWVAVSNNKLAAHALGGTSRSSFHAAVSQMGRRKRQDWFSKMDASHAALHRYRSQAMGLRKRSRREAAGGSVINLKRQRSSFSSSSSRSSHYSSSAASSLSSESESMSSCSVSLPSSGSSNSGS